MSRPEIPDFSISRDDAINLVIASIAMEELGLSHVINAEGEKIQYALGTIPGENSPQATIDDILAVDKSISGILDTIVKKEMLLDAKLNSAVNSAVLEGPTGPTGPAGGIASSAYIYATTAQGVADNAAVAFDSPSIGTDPIRFTSPSEQIELTASGNYLVTFEVSVATGGGGEWAIAVDGAVAQPRTYNSRSSNSQIFGEAIINITATPLTPALLTIVNFSGGAVTLSNGLSGGGKPNTAVSASVVILKIS